MAMKLVKRTDQYSIYLRGDKRYAVEDAGKQPVNSEDKFRILVAEGLLKVASPAKVEEPAEEEAAAAEGDEAEGGESEAAADEPAAQEPAAEEPADDAN